MLEPVRVLIIEDEPSVLDALRLILEDCGYRVASASDGARGLSQARAQDFDVVITDLRLPDMTGLDVLDSLRRARSRVLLITSHGTAEVLAEARRRGAAGTLLKPFLPSQILQLIADTLTLTRRPAAFS